MRVRATHACANGAGPPYPESTVRSLRWRRCRSAWVRAPAGRPAPDGETRSCLVSKKKPLRTSRGPLRKRNWTTRVLIRFPRLLFLRPGRPAAHAEFKLACVTNKPARLLLSLLLAGLGLTDYFDLILSGDSLPRKKHDAFRFPLVPLRSGFSGIGLRRTLLMVWRFLLVDTASAPRGPVAPVFPAFLMGYRGTLSVQELGLRCYSTHAPWDLPDLIRPCAV